MTDPGTGEQRSSVGFWVIVVAASLYLGLRLFEGVVWLVERLR